MSYPKAYLYRRIVLAKLYIDNCFADKIDLEMIAGEASFSRFHFIRLFKKIYGRTPHQYLRFVRIEHAKQLLRERASVTEASLDVGFDSLGSFSTLFGQMVGKSPSAYVSEQQNIRSRMSDKPLNFVPGCFAEENDWHEKSNFKEARG